ncbi:MAG: hypothetical protein WD341_14845 [Tistlia sp.]|uniref:hypothetical protein n=1 Tax=Tistlia sp. TaxID=3057121 RepID=UPI0034A3E8E1
MTKRSAALLGFLSAMIATTVVASTTEASATLLITDNWRYTTSNTSSTSDASASYSPLTFTNLVAPDGLSGETSATAQGTATAFEDLLGGNSASVDLEFTFQFSVNKSKPLFIVLLADQLTGSLSLQDTESDPGGASYFSNATLVRTNTNAVVASLPSRVGLRRAEGTSTVNESVLFGSNVFSIPNGDYSLTGTLNLDAVATAGVGDDRVQSSFKYQVKMRWVEVPAPPTVLLLLAGLAALPFCAGRARWRAA